MLLRCNDYDVRTEEVCYHDLPTIDVIKSPDQLLLAMSVLPGYTLLEVNGQQLLVPDHAVEDVNMKLAAKEKYHKMGGTSITEEVSIS